MSDVVDTMREKIAESAKRAKPIFEAESKLSQSVFEAYKEFAYEVYKIFYKFDNDDSLIAYDYDLEQLKVYSKFHVMSLAYDLIADLETEHQLEDLFHNRVLSSMIKARIDKHIEKQKKLAS